MARKSQKGEAGFPASPRLDLNPFFTEGGPNAEYQTKAF
jgi:hypothetical protein